jgi:hypothetical protein
MSLRSIVDVALTGKEKTKIGYIASPFYQYFDTAGNWVWACDVDIGEKEVLRCVPVASNNREIIYAEEGKSVTLTRLGQGKWVITGLAKTKPSTVHYIYVTFEEDLFRISRKELKGWYIRALTYGELGGLGGTGYGLLPYGARGKFNADGTFIEIVEWL